MKKVILVMISLFICMVAIGQDDMYMSHQKKENIKVRIFDATSGQEKHILERYCGVAVVVVEANGKKYDTRMIIKCKKITEKYLMIEYNKKMKEKENYFIY